MLKRVCTSAKPVAYLYKYTFKDSDSAAVSTIVRALNQPVRWINNAPAHRNDDVEPLDEVQVFHDAKKIGSCEAAWKILGLSCGEFKPAVGRQQVHLEDEQQCVFNPGGRQTEEQMLESERLSQPKLT